MTIVVDWDEKQQNKQTNKNYLFSDIEFMDYWINCYRVPQRFAGFVDILYLQ